MPAHNYMRIPSAPQLDPIAQEVLRQWRGQRVAYVRQRQHIQAMSLAMPTLPLGHINALPFSGIWSRTCWLRIISSVPS
jgi:hypothetical protein